MNMAEIKSAVDAGRTVHLANEGYPWFIVTSLAST
jgi:hypothetical protein